MSIKRVVASYVAVTTLAASTAALALPNEDFQGKPDFKVGEAIGAFVWHDADGQHVRFTTKGKVKRKFAGKVCSDKILSHAPHELEDGDASRIGPEEHCVIFDLTTDGHVDGFDFRAEGAIVTYDFSFDGKQMPTKMIHIGAKGLNPNESPFVLNRN